MRRFAIALVVATLCASLPAVATADETGPAAAIGAYAAALNAHDLPAALALFDQYGSATDIHGHHFEGAVGLTQFLEQSGFHDPNTRITTQNVHVVANRAVWTYSCTCAPEPTEVRLVVNRDRISVFAIQAPPASVSRAKAPTTVPMPGLIAFLALAASIGALSAHVLRSQPPSPRRPAGQLLIALAAARPRDHALSVNADRTGRH
jgi:hypothetical protein